MFKNNIRIIFTKVDTADKIRHVSFFCLINLFIYFMEIIKWESLSLSLIL